MVLKLDLVVLHAGFTACAPINRLMTAEFSLINVLAFTAP